VGREGNRPNLLRLRADNSPDEVENEVAINDDGLTVKLWAHIGCLDTWRRASEVYREEHPSSFTDSVDGDRI